LDWIGKIDVIRSGACAYSSVVRIRSGHVGGSGLGLADLGEPRQVSLRNSVSWFGLHMRFQLRLDFTSHTHKHSQILESRNIIFIYLPICLQPHPLTQ